MDPRTPDPDRSAGEKRNSADQERNPVFELFGPLEPEPVPRADPPGAGPAQTGVNPALTRLDAWWGRTLRTPARLRAWYWGGPAAVTVLAAILRFWKLGFPHALVFDETYYVKDAWTLMHLGYEGAWGNNPDPQFNAGHVYGYSSAPEFVAHPPLGKWMISLGLRLFGAQSSFGWRFTTALVGVLAVVLLMLIARALFHSTLLAVIAGFLMAIDGNAIVMSRVALLDNSVMFFALLAFGCLLLDRSWHARRLARWMAARRDRPDPPSWGPTLWWRPWLITAGILLGACTGVKWNGVYFLAFFAVYTVLTDAAARRREGLDFWISGAVLKQAPATFLLMVPIAFATYLTTWTGWIVTSGGYFRDYVQTTPGTLWRGSLSWVPHWFQNLWHYQVQMYDYSINLHVYHPYAANPLTWLFMVRPTSMYYEGYTSGQAGCTAAVCSSAITDIANPLIWYAATAAVFYLVYRLIRYREWQVGFILLGLAAGYLPWLLYLGRTVFEFYVIAFEPYMLLALVFAIGLILGKRTDPIARRRRGIRIIGAFLGLASVLSIFWYPLWTGEVVPFGFWQSHIWFSSWR